MIELQDDRLVFTAPEVHPQARFTVSLQRISYRMDHF